MDFLSWGIFCWGIFQPIPIPSPSKKFNLNKVQFHNFHAIQPATLTQDCPRLSENLVMWIVSKAIKMRSEKIKLGEREKCLGARTIRLRPDVGAVAVLRHRNVPTHCRSRVLDELLAQIADICRCLVGMLRNRPTRAYQARRRHSERP